MKKLLTILLLSLVMFGCRKDNITITNNIDSVFVTEMIFQIIDRDDLVTTVYSYIEIGDIVFDTEKSYNVKNIHKFVCIGNKPIKASGEITTKWIRYNNITKFKEGDINRIKIKFKSNNGNEWVQTYTVKSKVKSHYNSLQSYTMYDVTILLYDDYNKVVIGSKSENLIVNDSDLGDLNH